MTNAIKESRTLAVREAGGAKSGRLKIGLISPGWGSSGYYSDKVLENAATSKVFPAGTQMFLDHPGEAEAYDRPERSLRDLAAVLLEDATWDGEYLVAETQVFGPYVDLLTDEEFAKAIGVSIRAFADSRVGEAEGRKGRIITELVESISADFVTKAGRGGQILQVLESARPEVVERAIAHGVAEATANDTREALNAALLEGYGGEKSWVWVRDFDETTVWFTHDTPDESTTYAQAYQLQDDGSVLLDGEPTEVRARTEYVPVVPVITPAAESGTTTVPAPAGQPHPTHQSKEDTMGNIQVDEAQHASLTEAAGRVPTLESERDTEKQRADVAEAALRDRDNRDNRDAAVAVIAKEAKEANVEFTALESKGLLAELPTDADGKVDEAKFTEAVKTAAATKATESGAGTITGFGRTSTESGAVTVKESTASVMGAFGIPTSQEG